MPCIDPWLSQQIARDAAFREGLAVAFGGQPMPDWARRVTDDFFLSHFQPMQIPFKRLHPTAKAPTRAHNTDAGFDLYALQSDQYSPEKQFAVHPALRPGERRLFKTGIALAIPAGYYGHICDRSGNALKRGLHVLGGIVDSGYLGDIGVILFNTSEDTIWIEAGERIAQIIVKRHESPEFVEREDLEQSARGAGGFGSSGT
jgi:dUTP pyrophosphatase